MQSAQVELIPMGDTTPLLVILAKLAGKEQKHEHVPVSAVFFGACLTLKCRQLT